jgi:hypothetical protein
MHALTLSNRDVTHKAAIVGTSEQVWRMQKVMPVGG